MTNKLCAPDREHNGHFGLLGISFLEGHKAKERGNDGHGLHGLHKFLPCPTLLIKTTTNQFQYLPVCLLVWSSWSSSCLTLLALATVVWVYADTHRCSLSAVSPPSSSFTGCLISAEETKKKSNHVWRIDTSDCHPHGHIFISMYYQ